MYIPSGTAASQHNMRQNLRSCEASDATHALRDIGVRDVVVGIPSHNEASSIAKVVHATDKGLTDHLSHCRCLIVNADNASPDGTREAFEAVITKTPKLYISTPPGLKGKGHNVFNIFAAATHLGSPAVVLLDADLRSAESSWIPALCRPVLEGELDLVTPLYLRHRYDATVTNHLCFPLIYGVLGVSVRQPIGGEFGVSPGLYKHLLKQSWSPAADGYGVDIFLTLNALLSGFRISETKLGTKLHKPSAPKLNAIFSDIAEVCLQELHAIRAGTQKAHRLVAEPPNARHIAALNAEGLHASASNWSEEARTRLAPLLPRARAIIGRETSNRLEEHLTLRLDGIGAHLWADVVFRVLRSYADTSSSRDLLELLQAAFFGRLAAFHSSLPTLTYLEFEEQLLQQARIFRRKAVESAEI